MRSSQALLGAALLTASLLVFGAATAMPSTPSVDRRGPEQTFLTFPEWYLVHSPAEYAGYLTNSLHPSHFPLFAHIGQFWQGYAAVTGATRDFAFNPGYHLMVLVIGTSTTMEYALKGTYEHTVGRLAEATRQDSLTPEEAFAAKTAQDYVDFIRVDPWYLFDFKSRIAGLWSLTAAGPNALRRMERRYVLTSEYLVKETYARFIKLATRSIYNPPKPTTVVMLARAPAPDESHPEFTVIASSEGRTLAAMPRYEAFTTYARWIANQRADFEEIAGNRGDIVVSVLVRDGGIPVLTGTRELFSQPIHTRPGLRRDVLTVPVSRLSEMVRHEGPSFVIEHVYDY